MVDERLRGNKGKHGWLRDGHAAHRTTQVFRDGIPVIHADARDDATFLIKPWDSGAVKSVGWDYW